MRAARYGAVRVRRLTAPTVLLACSNTLAVSDSLRKTAGTARPTAIDSDD